MPPFSLFFFTGIFLSLPYANSSALEFTLAVFLLTTFVQAASDSSLLIIAFAEVGTAGLVGLVGPTLTRMVHLLVPSCHCTPTQWGSDPNERLRQLE